MDLLKPSVPRHTHFMSDPLSPTLLILLISALGLLIMLVGLALAMLHRLSRIDKLVAQAVEYQATSSPTPPLAPTNPGGTFDTFLNEDPARRKLLKSEQFAAYRQWRQDQGLNWSNS
ncbi:MAG: hypothetical protein RLZZ282_952 [Verrucomicrobiota bacterium]|jgi:flagellar basal body-associated protein FliL